MTEPTGYALCIGVNDPPRLGKPLVAPETIARDMGSFATLLGFGQVNQLTGGHATHRQVTAALADLAARARPGDLVMLTFAGHGGRLLDAEGARGHAEELVRECWHLVDAPFSDADLAGALARFADGVRVLVVSESCFAGGMASLLNDHPDYQARHHARRERAERWLADAPPDGGGRSGPSVRFFLAAPEDNAAFASRRTGAFTRALLTAYSEPASAGTYRDFWRAVVAAFARLQVKYADTPVFDESGPPLPEAAWGPPFSVDPRRPGPRLSLHELLPPTQLHPTFDEARGGKLTSFIGKLMENEGGLLDTFLDPKTDASGRIAMLQRAGLDPRAVGVVLREDAEAAVGLVAGEVIAWARARKVAAGEVATQPLWPGASLLVKEVSPREVPAGRPIELRVAGWHFPERPSAFRVAFQGPDGSAVPALVLDTAPVDAYGQWEAQVRVTLPVAGAWAVYVGDQERAEVSSLGAAVTATG